MTICEGRWRGNRELRDGFRWGGQACEAVKFDKLMSVSLHLDREAGLPLQFFSLRRIFTYLLHNFRLLVFYFELGLMRYANCITNE